MDTSYLTSQVATIIAQLHGLFDEIGVPNHDRESRESELFSALSETLHNQVRLVSAEKNDMTDEAQRIVTNIKQMETSLDDEKSQHEYEAEDEELKITYPLIRCLQVLKEKHQQISRLHKERFEQVKKLVQALESYSSHLESSFIQITLPPTAPNSTIPPTFDLSPKYVTALDDEFTRVYEEYTRRVATVKALSENIIQLWAELGTPQAQTDGMIVKYYRDSPEQLGLHEEDVARLRQKRDKLAEEKRSREKRLKDLKSTVEALWEKLGVEGPDRKKFINSNRGCGVRQINEFEDELSRLNDLKRQNLHLFVEDARYKLQELWDGLYFSEEEMLDFTPAFSDVYSDALLEAHEQEISRLEALKEQRAPTLALIDQHRSLVKDRNDLQASSQDASRLLGRGQKGEKRDPTRLLREEKMRKRIAKDLPKIAVQLRKVLENWEDEYGRPFLVHGERYLNELEASESKPAPGPRSKTPAGPLPSATKSQKSAPPSRSNSVKAPPPRTGGAKTPTAGGALRRNPILNSTGTKSPSKIPARAPLSHLNHGNNSPERKPRPESRMDADRTIRGKMAPPPMRAPPPKMRDLMAPPPVQTPVSHFRPESVLSSGSVRHVSPEDPYGYPEQHQRSRDYQQEHQRSQGYPQEHQQSRNFHELKSSMPQNDRFTNSVPYSMAPPSRQISNTSSATTSGVSGSENWETYSEVSEPEEDASDAYYEKLRATRIKRFTPDDGYAPPQGGPLKKQKGIPPCGAHAGHVITDANGNRIPSGSEANWTDEDAF
ncbi:microtubule associated protein-domain-containing protein [Amylocarpus encephaloides]|uniref:Microtubule associated protein-domain-containing protein n=1 Tax=Amylocarpus encephaloides TaxID=45428 RepID=A0A9P7YLR9_9HELO|nr:microtubule associated protein-domain-containing protein [Amylocarpus encephaloides]